MKKIKKVCLSILLVLFTLTNVAFAAQIPSDIAGHWAEADIKAAVEEGWAYVENGEFEPNKAASREEVVWMLIGKCNLLKPEGYDASKKADLSKYKDEPSEWAKDRMATAVGNGYIKGYSDETIGAQKPITRAELAVLLSRLMKGSTSSKELPFTDSIPAWAKDGIKKAYEAGIIKGYPDGTFGPNNNVTKAEALAMIKRWSEIGKVSEELVLTKEDERRLMEEYPIKTEPYGLTNEEMKKRVGNYSIYLQVAKEYVELVENYNYKEIATEAGKKEYLAGFEKYTPYTGGFLKKEEDMKLKYITENKLIKETKFLINDNCIFASSSGMTTVRGVMYFKFYEIGSGSLPFGDIELKPGIQYKIDVEMVLTGRSYYTEPTQFKVNRFGYISEATEVK